MKQIAITIFFFSILALPISAQVPLHTFALGDSSFLLDGRPFQIISGEMHYARIPQESWRHRLRMARAMGLNAISTCVFWNYHEMKQGEFDFRTENRNIAKFIRMAQEEGLWVILRPGPYVCAEWEFGGLPWWLLMNKDLAIRSRDTSFLNACEKYISRLSAEIKNLQITHGGPIILCQIENEYGSFGSDKIYMGLLRDMFLSSGIDVPLFTADGASQCRKGCLEGVLPAINGEENAANLRDTVRRFNNGKGPFFIPEFYSSWIDTWGASRIIILAEETLEKYGALLKEGVSVNLYMFHGGTNFGFMNGANYSNEFPVFPQTTCNNSDALLDEAGRPTEKYFKYRNAILGYLSIDSISLPIPESLKVIDIPSISLNGSSSMNEILKTPVSSRRPLSMEDIGQGYGYILYRTLIQEPTRGLLKISGLRDYGIVLLNGKRAAVLDWRLGQDSVFIISNEGNTVLDILVENEGRINFGGEMLHERKGIAGKVKLNGRELVNWKLFQLQFDALKKITFNEFSSESAPLLRKGTFALSKTGDTFLDMTQWGKGCVWINGHNLGRFWYIGPQQTLYVPGPWLKKGKNEIIIFDLLNEKQNEARFATEPILDSLRTQKVLFHPRYDSLKNSISVSMSSDDADATIHFTSDGKEPTEAYETYAHPFEAMAKTNIAARAYRDGIATAPSTKIAITPSLSTGKSIKFGAAFSRQYSGGGDCALVDGIRGSLDFRDGFWQGYLGNDCIATIDLGEVKNISKISAEFLQNFDEGIFLPLSVTFSVSNDAAAFTVISDTANSINPKNSGVFKRSFSTQTHVAARYVKMIAKNMGIYPQVHGQAGKKAWMFIDEISVE